MSSWKLALPVVALVLAPAPAAALKPGKHRSIAEASCKNVHLPRAFCRRMGKAVYETDYREWTALSAHAQTERGQDRCEAADAATSRVDRLARSVVAAAAAGDLETAAVDLGRALHTIQDECAHHGMTNEQHAYLSLEQTCGDEDVSPDVQPEALACATARTAAVMRLVAPALAGTRWTNVDALCTDPFAERDTDTCATAVLPTPFMACDFLSQYDAWDGTDSTWDGTAVGPALVDAFAAGLRGTPASSSVCGGVPTAIDPEAHPTRSVGDPTCGLIDIGCLGKVDADADVDPYGEERRTGGCATGGSASWLVALVIALGTIRRRRR